MSIKVGDKFIIEIGTIAELPDGKKKYFIKPFESLVFDRKGLEQLERLDKAMGNIYETGLEDGYKGYRYLNQWFADTCFYDDEDNLFPEYKRRQADTCCLEDIITDVGFSEVLKRVKAYEEKKKAEKESIKVGDEVVIDDKGRKAIVTRVLDNDLYNIVFYNGDTNCVDRPFIGKTGRHFDEVEQLLDKLRGE